MKQQQFAESESLFVLQKQLQEVLGECYATLTLTYHIT